MKKLLIVLGMVLFQGCALMEAQRAPLVDVGGIVDSLISLRAFRVAAEAERGQAAINDELKNGLLLLVDTAIAPGLGFSGPVDKWVVAWAGDLETKIFLILDVRRAGQVKGAVTRAVVCWKLDRGTSEWIITDGKRGY